MTCEMELISHSAQQQLKSLNSSSPRNRNEQVCPSKSDFQAKTPSGQIWWTSSCYILPWIKWASIGLGSLIQWDGESSSVDRPSGAQVLVQPLARFMNLCGRFEVLSAVVSIIASHSLTIQTDHSFRYWDSLVSRDLQFSQVKYPFREVSLILWHSIRRSTRNYSRGRLRLTSLAIMILAVQ